MYVAVAILEKMYLGVDIGGTKTLVARLDSHGVIQAHHKFPTPEMYTDFLNELAVSVDKISTEKFTAVGVGIPGSVDRVHGVGIRFSNLTWQDVPIKSDVQKLVDCPVVVENDAKLGGLSEAMLLKEFSKVLYVTIGTGIGIALTVNGEIDTSIADGGGRAILLQHAGKLEPWESFASGHAIVRRFGKQASEITDTKIWKIFAHDVAIGLIDLIALTQPDIIVLGGGVSGHYDKFGKFLDKYLHDYENPMLVVPPVKQASRPAFAVLYGCYDLAEQTYGKST